MSSPIKRVLTESDHSSTHFSSTQSSNFHVGECSLHSCSRSFSLSSVSSGKSEIHFDGTNNFSRLSPNFFRNKFKSARVYQHWALKKQESDISLNLPNFKPASEVSNTCVSPTDFSIKQKSQSIIAKKSIFESDTECKIITPPLSPAFHKDISRVSQSKSNSSPYLLIVELPSSGTQRSSSFSSASRRRGGSISKRGNSRKSSSSKDKQKDTNSMPNDFNLNRDRRDSGGDRERDKLVVKARQRTAIACNYCRRRKIRCSGNPNTDGNEEDPRCNNCKRFNQECVFAPVSASVTTIPLVTQKQLYPHDPHNQGYLMYPPLPLPGHPARFDSYHDGSHISYGNQYPPQQHSSDGIGYGHPSQHTLGPPYPSPNTHDSHNYPPINSSMNQLQYLSISQPHPPHPHPPPPLPPLPQQQLPHFSHQSHQPSYYSQHHAIESRQPPILPPPQSQQPPILPSQQWQAPHPPFPTQSQLHSLNASYSQASTLPSQHYKAGEGGFNQHLQPPQNLEPLTRQQHSPSLGEASPASSLDKQHQQSQPTMQAVASGKKNNNDQASKMRKSGRVSISDLLD